MSDELEQTAEIAGSDEEVDASDATPRPSASAPALREGVALSVLVWVEDE
jgi:hypothetical protein